MTRKLTSLFAALPLVIASASASHAATATGIGSIADSVNSNVQAFVPLIVILAFLGGLFFAVSAILKMKDAKENPRDNPPGTIALNWAAAVFLIGLGSIIGLMSNTFGVDETPLTGSQTVTYN